MKWHRIKPGVRPYGGKVFQELRGSETTAIGWVHTSSSRLAVGQRMFYRHELESIETPAWAVQQAI